MASVKKTTAPLVQHASYRWGMSAGLAESLAEELRALAKRLRSDDETAEMKDRIAAELHRVLRASRGVSDDKTVRVSLVRAVEEAIKHVRFCRAELAAALSRLQVDPTNDVDRARVELSRWLRDDSEERDAHDRFSIEWPAHARKMRLVDWKQASAAVRGKTKDKWGTLASIIEARLQIKTAAATLQTDVRRSRKRH